MDHVGENCGVFGIYNHPHAAEMTYLGLYALQHRGQESAGIVSSDGSRLYGYKAMGLVAEVFRPDHLNELPGQMAIGHVRYSTTGSSTLINAQPFKVESAKGQLAVAHNGNLVNCLRLRAEMERQGSIFQTSMDSEIIVHIIARSRPRDILKSILYALTRIRGAYSLVFLTPKALIGARDPHGFRPLAIGKLGDAYLLASETCALDLLRAEYIREVEPGEMVVIDENGITSFHPHKPTALAHCIFEYIYFARPDSRVFGSSVLLTRKRLGERLAQEYPVAADLVMPIPDSGNAAAIGYAQAAGLPYEMGMVRNHYIGRTFIQPSQDIRDFGVKVKLNPVREVIQGRSLVVVEDSIVRGTTGRNRIRALREAGARSIHMRITCPPLRFPCFYGIDFPTREELIASNKSIPEIADYLELDSLGYLSLEGMLSCMEAGRRNFCTACFSGRYPIRTSDLTHKFHFETPPKC